MIGITAYGGYVPRLRLSRQAVAQANAWYAPQFAGRKGTRAFANWDEDSITMAVAAGARLPRPGRQTAAACAALFLASDTLPFAERLNAGVVAGALTLDEGIEALDLGGTPTRRAVGADAGRGPRAGRRRRHAGAGGRQPPHPRRQRAGAGLRRRAPRPCWSAARTCWPSTWAAAP